MASPAPTSTTTGKPPATWTGKYTTPVSTSQGGKMMAKVKDSKSEAPKWGRDNLPPGVNPAFLPDAGKTKSPVVMSGKMAKEKNGLSFIESGIKPKSPKPLSTKTHKPTYVKPFETDKSPVSSKTPKLVTTREDKTAMAWAPSPKIMGMQKKEGQIVLTTTAGEKKYPSGTPARREGEYLFIGQKPGEEKFYYPMKKST